MIPTEPLFPADDLDLTPPARVADLDDRGFDPKAVRLTGLRPVEWADEPACNGAASRGNDPWHPGPDGDDEAAYPSIARETCLRCPVREKCLALGLALLPLGDVHGMYGGLTPPELREAARRGGYADRVVAQHGTRASYVEGCRCADCLRAHNAYYVEKRREDSYDRPTDPIPLPVPEPEHLATLLDLPEVS